jgi:hypothetical protein
LKAKLITQLALTVALQGNYFSTLPTKTKGLLLNRYYENKNLIRSAQSGDDLSEESSMITMAMEPILDMTKYTNKFDALPDIVEKGQLKNIFGGDDLSESSHQSRSLSSSQFTKLFFKKSKSVRLKQPKETVNPYDSEVKVP